MNFILNLETQRLRQSSVKEPDHFEKRISLEGKFKCIDHDISLGGVQPLTEGVGIVRLLDASDEPELDYNVQNEVGRLFIIEDYGEWQVTAEVVLSHEEFTEIWNRLKDDKSLRSSKLLISDGQDDAGTKSITFQSRAIFRVEAIEVEFSYDF